MRRGVLFPSVNQDKILLNLPVTPSAQMVEAYAVVRSKCRYTVKMVLYNRTWGEWEVYFRVLKRLKELLELHHYIIYIRRKAKL